MTRFDPRKGVLARHVGHPLQGIDVRSVRCTSCAVTLLLDANREAPDEPQARTPATRPTAPLQLPACHRCGRRVRHVDVDGVPEPQPHTDPRSAGQRLCNGAEPAQLPPGGWRELVAQLGAPAPVEVEPLGTSAQHDGPGVRSQAVDTSTTRPDRVADAALSSVGAPQHKTRGS